MKFLSRVVWSEGMHLGPHHFQTQSRYFEDSLWFLSSGLRRHPWGILGLSLDEQAIQNGKAVLLFASGIFPDGLVFDIPESDPAPPALNLRDLFSPTDSELVLYLSVPRRKTQGLDCDLADAQDDGARYRSVERSLMDETFGTDEYAVAFGNKNITLRSRAQLTSDCVSFPIARVFRDGKGGFGIDADFIPPCLRIGANEALLLRLRHLIEALQDRIAVTSRGKQKQGQFEAGLSAPSVANYWFLHSLCSALPSLQQHFEGKKSHPEELYLDMARLAGSLCTFSLDSNPTDIVPYSHLELARVFQLLDEHIRRHLEIVAPSNTVTLTFRPNGAYLHVADVADERCFRRARWVFGIRSALAESELLRLTPQLVKVCSGEGVAKLVQRALPGLELLSIPVPPTAMTAEADMRYFSLGATGACWQHILQTRQVGVYIPGDIKDAAFELTVILETTA